MSAGGSTKVILIALCANFGIALSKLAGSLFTGSAALMAEAIHSFADCGNQGLLLYGQKASSKAASERHPLGYGKEAFFWSFVVALLLFSMGGLFSLYEGIHKIMHPGELSYPWVGVAILSGAVLLEGYSFYACLKEVKAENRFGSLRAWMRQTTNAELLVIFLEDLAALLGLIFALCALLLAIVTGNTLWDGIGSFVIGLLLIIVAVVLAREVKSLLVGESPAFDYKAVIEKNLAKEIPSAKLLRLIALQTGSKQVLLSYKISTGDIKDVKSLIASMNTLEKKVKKACPEVTWQFVEPDDHA